MQQICVTLPKNEGVGETWGHYQPADISPSRRYGGAILSTLALLEEICERMETVYVLIVVIESQASVLIVCLHRKPFI